MERLVFPVLVGLVAGLSACSGEAQNAVVNAAPANAVAAAVPAPVVAAPRPSGPAAPLLPPNAQVAGDAVHPDDLEIIFSSPEPPQRVIAWYRQAARGGAFTVGSELTEGAEQVLTGQVRETRQEWTVRLSPDDQGGTAAMLLLTAG